jgi:hypothetical protein
MENKTTLRSVIHTWFWISFWNVVVSIGWDLTVTVEIVVTVAAVVFGILAVIENKGGIVE